MFLKDTLKAFPKEQYPDHKTVVVSISSLLAVQAFPNWGLYAAGKAARDRLLGVIALEEVSFCVLEPLLPFLFFSYLLLFCCCYSAVAILLQEGERESDLI